MSFASPHIIDPEGQHTHTIICLHGRGSTGTNFSVELMETRTSQKENLRDLLSTYRWIFPTCPPCYSSRFEEHMNQWYDIHSLTNIEDQSEIQVEGLRYSVEYLRRLVKSEAEASPNGKVIVLGISQGLTVASIAMLTGLPQVEAVIGFSSWLPFTTPIENAMGTPTIDVKSKRHRVAQALTKALGLSQLPDESSLQETHPPIFLTHCANDYVIEADLGRNLRTVLENLGFDLSWLETPRGGHWINEPDGMDGVKIFMEQHGLIKN